jgi:hypothetical protein
MKYKSNARATRHFVIVFLLLLSSAAVALVAPAQAVKLKFVPAQGQSNTLGFLQIAQQAPLYTMRLTPVVGTFHCQAQAKRQSANSLLLDCANGTTDTEVQLDLSYSEQTLVLDLRASAPIISKLALTPTEDASRYQAIAVPYLTSPVLAWKQDSLFTRAQVNWRKSNASGINDDEVAYNALTDGTRHRLQEEILVRASYSFDEVLPAIDNPASPYRATMAGTTVFDIWEKQFSAVQQGFAQLAQYDLGKCLGIVHNWQYFGYDNGLPQHLPANPNSGGNAGLLAAVAQGKADGCRMALHENYVDYYANYPNYSDHALARKSDSTAQLSWLNKSVNQQSYAEKPSMMAGFAQKQSPQIHAQFGTDASYLDVNSAVNLSFHTDMEAGTPGAGLAAASTQASVALWAYLRQTHQGPALGEGVRHWYYSGLLDGVEAQLGTKNTPANSDAALPLLVNFDLLRIHPLQVNHGMGYYERWSANKTASLSSLQFDAYRMQEIAFGHAPFLGQRAWTLAPQVLVETHLIAPVAEAYGLAQASLIEYGDEGRWIPSSQAILEHKLTQVHVRYDNGLEIVANANAAPLLWQGKQIPQYGWMATGAGVHAYTALCGTQLCDYAETAQSVFANARNAHAYLAASAPLAVRASNWALSDNFHANLQVHWEAFDANRISPNLRGFMHFVRADGSIAFQTTSKIATLLHGTSIIEENIPVEIPSSVGDGIYSVRIGIYDPATGVRQSLAGNDDGSNRYILGNLAISQHATTVRWQAASPAPAENRLNASGSVVDFGSVRTNGMIWMHKSGNTWTLQVFPHNTSVSVALEASRFPTPHAVQAESSSQSVQPKENNGYWTLPINGSASYTWTTNR